MEKIELIKKLKELKGNLKNMDYENIHCELINTLSEYDDNNKHDNIYLVDYYKELMEVIDNEILDYLLEDIGADLPRLRYFINGTYNAEIYLLNGYGNLENISDSDFESVVDDLIDNILKKEGKNNG